MTDELCDSAWNDFISFLQNLNCIKIERFVFVAITDGFCYSSTEVYRAAILNSC